VLEQQANEAAGTDASIFPSLMLCQTRATKSNPRRNGCDRKRPSPNTFKARLLEDPARAFVNDPGVAPLC
jgi:hypothetical protein